MKPKFNIFFWILSFIILYRLFTIDYNNGIVDVVYTIVFHIPLIVVFYLNMLLIDKLLNEEKHIVYVFSLMVLLVIGVILHYVVFDFICALLVPNFYMISMSVIEISQYIATYIIVSLLIRMSYDRFIIKNHKRTLEHDLKNNQLKQLKAQLNPHFLFNSLNNIYALTSIDVQKGRESIIKLSDSLRYMLYKTDAERVLVENEVEYLNNYIELEKLRLETIENINISLPDIIGDQTIAPLILLLFVENCFKHCDKSSPEIEIKISMDKEQLNLICYNNKPETGPDRDGGVGLSLPFTHKYYNNM